MYLKWKEAAHATAASLGIKISLKIKIISYKNPIVHFHYLL
jgi:hypothetical protein